MTKLIEAIDKNEEVFKRILNDGCLPEADEEMNQSTREIVQALIDLNGFAVIGKVNLHGEDTDDRAMWRTTEPPLNFGASYVIPQEDEVLRGMILERRHAPYAGMRTDWHLICAIFKRIKKLGGQPLIFT